MMPDNFSDHRTGLTSPANNIEVVNASTANHTFSFTTRAIYVGGAGNLEVVLESGDQGVFASVPAGTILPIRCTTVVSTGTAATNMLGLW